MAPIRQRKKKRVLSAAGVVGLTLLLTGCTEREQRGYLPKGVTSIADDFTNFWVGTWIWALAVGVLVWGLTFWCIVRYRRKKTETGLPPQVAYHVPIEILFTVVPVLMVAVLFGKTVELENKMLEEKTPDVTVNVVGKQWSWDFNYVDEKVYEAGEQAHLTGKEGVQETLPTLYLPVNKRVEFVLTARDVIHTFWVIQFLHKMDMVPGKVNTFQVTPTEIGTFQGKCAELCGAYHSQMLFQVKVVSEADYNKYIDSLKAKGQNGFLPNSMVRSGSEMTKAEQQYLPKGLTEADVVEEGK